MAEKPTVESLKKKLLVLEQKNNAGGTKKAVLQKAYDALEQRMEKINADLIAAKNHLNQEVMDGGEVGQSRSNSHPLLQAIVDTTDVTVFVKDENGIYLFVNNAFGKDFSVDPDDIIGKDDFFVFSRETAEIIQKNDQQVMTGGIPVNVEESSILHGKHVTYLTNKVPLIDDNGKVIGICGVGFDITPSKKIEDELRKAKIKFQRLVEDISGYFVIYSHQLDGTLTYAGPGMDSVFGISLEKTIGSDWTKIIEWEPEDLSLAGENIHNMVSGMVYKRMPMSFRHPNGEQRTIFVTPYPVKNSEGIVVGVEGVIEDITERKKAEEALEEVHRDLERKVAERTDELSETVAKLKNAEFQYRTVADFTYDWEYWADLDGTLRYVSPSCERISGYTPKQFIGNPPLLREIIVPEDRELWDNHFHDSRCDFHAREIQFRIQTRDGQIRWIDHACQPVVDDNNEMMGIRAGNRDITDRKNDEINLQKAFDEINLLKKQLEADSTYLSEEIKLEHDYENIIGNSDVLKYVLLRAEQVAPTDATVLIMGETGTGKELIARMIHEASTRNKRPLIKLNCASLPESLIESELFGHEKGAFTSAVDRRVGRFELADGATLFLDEIGELPISLQPKLLRVLQDGEIERLGSSQTLRTDVRIIAATNRDLEGDVRKKMFRMDLWYRLNVFTITMPPLRERSEDIILLVNYMIKKFSRKLGKTITSVPSDAIARLQNFHWPGNIRELENVIERAVIDTDGETLHLKNVLHVFGSEKNTDSIEHSMKSLAEVERDHILQALKRCGWKIHGPDGAAALLDINPNTLRGRMRKHGIQRPK